MVVLAVVVVSGVSVAIALLRPDRYHAAAEVLLSGGTATGQQDAETAVRTEIRIVLGPAVRRAVRQQLGSAPRVTAKPLPKSRAFAIRATDASPVRAARVANAYASAYIELRRRQGVTDSIRASEALMAQIADLKRQIDATATQSAREALTEQQSALQRRVDQLTAETQQAAAGASVLTPAVAPRSPANASPIRSLGLGVLLGLGLGIAMALVSDHLDLVVRTKPDLEMASALPTLALVPRVRHWRDPGETLIVSRTEPSSPGAEAYRMLRTATQIHQGDRPLRSLQVTSPTRGEGKTTTVANLAIALSQAGQRVIAVDCDLRQPRLSEFFGLPNTAGLTSVMLGDVPLSSALQPVPGSQRLVLLPSGPTPPNPSEILASKRPAELLWALQMNCDIVLVDSPAVLPVTDAVVVARLVDSTMLVAASGISTRRQVASAIEVLTGAGANLLGTVLNGVREPAPYGYEGASTSQ